MSMPRKEECYKNCMVNFEKNVFFMLRKEAK